MKKYVPDQIFVEEAVADSPISREVLENTPGIAVHSIQSTDELLARVRVESPSIPTAKRSLILAEHKGRFFKHCPASQTRGSSANVCCNYFVVNYASNCHMECSYCYLQSYLNFPHLIIYANVQDLLDELKSVLAERKNSFLRIGTGELADSLALDPLSNYSQPLVELFAHHSNAVLEFKTKSNCVERLLDLDHKGRTVVSWSINPRHIQLTQEHKTATIDERLSAARRCVEAGYRVAFHFDPLIHYPDWKRDYRALVDEVFDTIASPAIAWISFGALRLTPQLKSVMRERFPGSFLPLGELVPAEDGKLRYAKPIRTEMLSAVHGWIRDRVSATTPVYACMERPEVWSKVFKRPIPLEEQVGEEITALIR